MRRVPLPGWLLALSAVLFTATWLAAPGETLSGEIDIDPSARLFRRGAKDPLSSKPRALAAASTVRPTKVLGFGRPFELALTFDDGPHPYHTRRLLDILDRHQIKGAFFVNGVWLNTTRAKGRARAVLQRAHLEGHMIGNHTYGHELLARLEPGQQTWQIVANELLVADLILHRTRIFRPPYGQMTRHATTVLDQYGYQEVLWNISAREEDGGDPSELAGQLLRWTMHHKGGIVLLHDRLSRSVDATEIFLARLHRLNCKRLRKNLPLYRVVGLDSFLKSPAESQALAERRRTERARFRQRMRGRCTRR